jgi:hypothetical protein
MSLNETGLLSKLNILAATLVHFHRLVCTTIIRVGMTQTARQRRCIAPAIQASRSLAPISECAGRESLAAMSPAFRHICARSWN